MPMLSFDLFERKGLRQLKLRTCSGVLFCSKKVQSLLQCPGREISATMKARSVNLI